MPQMGSSDGRVRRSQYTVHIRATTTAVYMEMIVPMISVTAKPLTVPDPKINRNTDEMITVRLESVIVPDAER